jgi:hypothetical protein
MSLCENPRAKKPLGKLEHFFFGSELGNAFFLEPGRLLRQQLLNRWKLKMCVEE